MAKKEKSEYEKRYDEAYAAQFPRFKPQGKQAVLYKDEEEADKLALNAYLTANQDVPALHGQAVLGLYNDKDFGSDVSYNAYLNPGKHPTMDDVYQESSFGLRGDGAELRAYLGSKGDFSEKGISASYNLPDGYQIQGKYSAPDRYPGDSKSLALYKYLNGGRAMAQVKKKSGKDPSISFQYNKAF